MKSMPAPSDLRIALRLLGFLRPFAAWTALSVLLGAAAVAAGVGLLGTSAYLIATAALHPSIAVLQVAIVGVRFFGIGRAVLRYLERLASHSVNFQLLARLRVWFYEALEPQVPARLVNDRSGDLLARSVGDIEALENFYVRAVAPPLSAVVVVCGVSLFIGRYDARLGWLLAAALLATGVGLPILAHLLARTPGEEVIVRRAALSHAVVDVVQGMGDLAASAQAQAGCRYVEKALAAGQALGVAQARLGRTGALANALSMLLTALALWGVLVIAIPLVGSRIDGVALAVLALVTLSAFEAVTPLSQAAQHLQSSLAAAGRLFELDQRKEVEDSVRASAPGSSNAVGTSRPPETTVLITGENQGEKAAPAGMEIQIEGVSFAYGPGLPLALENISLHIAPGTHAALVGPGGAGKSTLFALLLRLWEYQRGEIRLDGQDLRAFDPDVLRRSLAVVPQSTYLFAGTLRQNLALCAPDAGVQEMAWAVRQAGLAEWVAQLPEGLETRVGERGLQISGGERRRVTLARALLAGAAKARLLLLDEPTTHLDAVTERRFLRDLRQVAAGRSLVLITHRLLGLEDMDQVIVMQHGRIVECGRHLDLTQAGGLYARMWKIQNEIL